MNFKKVLKSFIGDRAFYKSTLAIALPMIIQNTVTNLVNLLDNLMVGSLGTEQMSGVAIVNQIFLERPTVINLSNFSIFGILPNSSMIKYTFRSNVNSSVADATLISVL